MKRFARIGLSVAFLKNASKQMNRKMTMVYWRGEKFWLGKLLEHPEIMTQGDTLAELEANIEDAYRMMVPEDVPDGHEV